MGLSADRAFVTNRGGTTVDIFDTVTGFPELTSVTVGSGPVDIVGDLPPSSGSNKLFVANSGSNTVSVLGLNPAGVIATITGDSAFGTFATPSGVALIGGGAIAPAIAVVDQKVVSYYSLGPVTGRSTVRFIDPGMNAVVDGFADPSALARYTDVVWTVDAATGTRRLWITDDGDGGEKGVVVVKFGSAASGPPFLMGSLLVFNGSGEFADFVQDTAAVKTFLVSPRRLATNGTTRVVVADGGSDVVTILDANYFTNDAVPGQPSAVVANVDLGAAAGVVCNDVEVVGGFAYVTTSNVAGANLHRIDLSTNLVTGSAAVGAVGVSGLGATVDGTTLLVGDSAPGGVISYRSATTLAAVAPVSTTPAGALAPFGFFSGTSGGGSGTPPPTWIPPGGTFPASSGSGSTCGLLGWEAPALLALLGLRRSGGVRRR
jgi:YVTN family beta-propeller protein